MHIGAENESIGTEKLHIGAEKLRVGAEKLRVGAEKLRMGARKLGMGFGKLRIGAENCVSNLSFYLGMENKFFTSSFFNFFQKVLKVCLFKELV